MVELIVAGVIIGGVCAAAVVTSVRDRRRRKEDRISSEHDGAPYGEPIPGGWVATSGTHGGSGGGE